VLPIINSLSKTYRILSNAMKINQDTLTSGNFQRAPPTDVLSTSASRQFFTVP
ncbi:hypothetical protein HGM15179_006977, partial [Zosterops borbonicus]